MEYQSSETLPYQVISIYFALSVMNSDYSDLNTIYEVIDGKTCWILISYHFTGIKHIDVIISKAFTIACLRHFLNHYFPNLNDKYIHLYQGDELFNNLDVKNLL